jgi:twitching motility protein PilT
MQNSVGVVQQFGGRCFVDAINGELNRLLIGLVRAGGSDLHLSVGATPSVRVDGILRPFSGVPVLTAEDSEQLARSVLSEAQWARFLLDNEIDFAYSIPEISRFRANVFRQRGTISAAFRAIPHDIPKIADLGLPDTVESFAGLPRGLVLITGPTGAGKTTTLAALVDVANRTRSAHIITIEDPIEYLHNHQLSVVNQREVGVDTGGFSSALRTALRQDPDIIVVGEMRDLETTTTAITAAETGHLVLATLHTRSAAQTIERLIDIFPANQQPQIRTQLASCLQAVVTQALVPRAGGVGRTVACELMIATPAVRNLIRDHKVHQIPSFMQASGDSGMMSFDQHLALLYSTQQINRHTALELAHDPAEFKRLAQVA